MATWVNRLRETSERSKPSSKGIALEKELASPKSYTFKTRKLVRRSLACCCCCCCCCCFCCCRSSCGGLWSWLLLSLLPQKAPRTSACTWIFRPPAFDHSGIFEEKARRFLAGWSGFPCFTLVQNGFGVVLGA